MFIGAYPCLSAIVILLGFAVVSVTLRNRQTGAAGDGPTPGRYFLLSVPISIGGLMLFVTLSLVVGLMHTGGAGSWNYPQDYIESGFFGWIIMALPVISLLAPLAIARIVVTRPGKTATRE